VSPESIRAAGGVVRRERDGRVEVAVIHRPRYDDWTIPKGKLEPQESDVDGAVREVLEETGLACVPIRELSPTRYRDHLGRAKVVRYWVMTPIAGEFIPNEEVDELRWLGIAEAASLLSYDRDRELLREMLAGG
jgi:8-oxo-dGTP pyrophosphatase MutT (NUDIX family)